MSTRNQSQLSVLLLAASAFIFGVMLTNMLHTTASAQQVQQAAVDFSPLANQAVGIAALVLSVAAAVVSKFVIGWLASKAKFTDSQAEALLADRVNDILQRSIEFAEGWAKTQVADPTSPLRRVEINNFFLEQALGFAMRSMPDLIAKFNLTPERIKQMILARLNGFMPVPEPNTGSTTVLTGGPASVLQPVTAGGTALNG